MWRSLAAHLLWEQGVGSSNLPFPTTSTRHDILTVEPLGSHVSAIYQSLNVLSRFIVDMSAPVAVFQFGDWLR